MVSCEAEHAKIPSQRQSNLVLALLANLNTNLSSLQIWRHTYVLLMTLYTLCKMYKMYKTLSSLLRETFPLDSSGFLWTTAQDVYSSGGISSQCILLLYSN